MDAAEHFDWSVARAQEYCDVDPSGTDAMMSLISDLGKHEGTASIITSELRYLFVDEVLTDGAAGAQRFIDGLPRPSGVST